MPIKGRSRDLIREGWPRGRTGWQTVSLSLSPSRTLVTPYCKRTRPGRRTTWRPLVSPLPVSSPPPFMLRLTRDPSRLGHVATIYSSVQGPPRVETPTIPHNLQGNMKAPSGHQLQGAEALGALKEGLGISLERFIAYSVVRTRAILQECVMSPFRNKRK
jgi:hypothetical protein